MAHNAPYKICFVHKNRETEEEDEKNYKTYKEIVAKLPTLEGWLGNSVYQYQSFWYNFDLVGVGPLAVQHHFTAQPTDILLASCGSNWLKSLAFSVMNRKSYPPSSQQHPLLTFNSNDLVPVMEVILYNNNLNCNQIPNLDILPSPRLFGTYMPYTSLPQSITHSDHARIIYICRNTKENFLSWWHFVNKFRSNISLEPMKLEEAFQWFCKGKSAFGPFWDHVLGYWKASLERPGNVLFLKCDDIMAQPNFYFKRMGDFMGYPFSSMEEKEGVVDQIIKLCSFENLSNLDVNKAASGPPLYGAYFRGNKVGDFANYLTPEMIEQLDHITEQKFHGSGLTL
ncbi:cytosolic sulfotransferase 5-like [Telopea speciosissima]|uniref:cytosolic sulfotransferase 5-like n=1 Tax=Telopea speciosissima TaxID=54955 RepID=UPI001CC4197D|nr:cytosolic sulfotransferase 5-like [Telopea speciosissima]